jgi:hypothetical protein
MVTSKFVQVTRLFNRIYGVLIPQLTYLNSTCSNVSPQVIAHPTIKKIPMSDLYDEE